MEPPPKEQPDSERDWRDPSQPRHPEDDIIAQGWRRRADGTFERINTGESGESVQNGAPEPKESNHDPRDD